MISLDYGEWGGVASDYVINYLYIDWKLGTLFFLYYHKIQHKLFYIVMKNDIRCHNL